MIGFKNSESNRSTTGPIDQIDKGQMTAREVMERTQEKLQQLGPVVERLLSEFLSTIGSFD